MTDRLTVDTINSDQLDALYDERDSLNRMHLTTMGNHSIACHRLDQIRDAARLHRQTLIGTSELYAVIEATEPEEQPATPQLLAVVWVVWQEDERVYGYFTTEDVAKQATIDCWEQDEPVCPDYSWRRDGPRWELVVGGEPGGVYASRHQVYGGRATDEAQQDGAAQ